MDGSSSSRDGSGKDGKRPAQSFIDKRMREPKRGLGIAKLEKMLMDGRSSTDGNHGNGTRPAQSFMDKLREPKRGLGVAKLEQMRAEEAMKEYLQDPISGSGIGIQGMALMDGSSTRDGNHGNGKRPAQSFIDKLREPKRGLGVANLEKMRAEEAMKDLKDHFSQAHIFGPGIGIQGMMSYPHGTGENMTGLFIVPFARPPSTSGAASHVNTSNTVPTGPPSTPGAASHVSPSSTEPTTLQLFPDHMEDEHADSKREGDHNLPVEPAAKNLDDHQDLDLELKL
nr:uncharacterized protein LOC117849023 [Setaria viridis]